MGRRRDGPGTSGGGDGDVSIVATRRTQRARGPLWRAAMVAVRVVGVMVALQAAVLGAISLVAVRRRRRRVPAKGFPHQEVREVEVRGNRLQIFSYGEDLYNAMFAAIEGARAFIFLESFIWKDDAIGQEFKERLARKAREGVRVCVIFDRFGNLVVPAEFKRFPPEIEVLEYSGFNLPWHFVDPRKYALDHRKLLVVDGAIGFLGGYNIGALYATQWRDTHLRIEGPEAADLAQSFVDFWDRARPAAKRLGRNFPLRFEPAVQYCTNDAARLIFPIRDMYIEAIDRAQRHIYITNAYFIPDGALLRALLDAARRGVAVQVLLPWASNHILADWLARGFFTDCLRGGIRIFGYKGVMIHAKTATIDGEWSTLGTANLDRLSEVGNHEINIQVYDPAFAREMEAIFACDKTNAFELTAERWVKRPWYVKASELVLAPLRPAL
ncbi:MAG TPA: phospholipase D-like domain-containing protein [Ktedonobacterales bacterium]